MNNQYKRENSSSNWALRTSIIFIAFVALSAFVWVVFIAEDGGGDIFSSDFLKPAKEEVEVAASVTEDDARTETVIPSFDIVRISRNGTGVIAGRAEPNSDVLVYAWDKKIGAAVADRNGEWVLLFDTPLPGGPTELSLRSQMPGEYEILSSNVVIVAVPPRNQERFIDDETSGVVAILSPRAGKGPSRVLQKPKNVNLGELAKGLSLDSLDYNDAGETLVSGTALPDAKVRVYLDNNYIGEVKASEEGTWILKARYNLEDKEHILRIDQILLDDDVEVRIEQPFRPHRELDKNRAKGEIIVRPGNSLWHIARKLYGSGFHYTLIFGANREMIGNPNLIYPGQKFTLPKNVKED